MKLNELVDRIYIDPRKLTAYALNPQNERGKDKVYVFRQTLGYTQDNYEQLLTQIEMKALAAEAVVQHRDAFGQRVRVDLEIEGVAGQLAIVRTGWLIPPDGSEAELMTLYVR
jgi:hypothetical protein